MKKGAFVSVFAGWLRGHLGAQGYRARATDNTFGSRTADNTGMLDYFVHFDSFTLVD
jgi:hypothetical protein